MLFITLHYRLPCFSDLILRSRNHLNLSGISLLFFIHCSAAMNEPASISHLFRRLSLSSPSNLMFVYALPFLSSIPSRGIRPLNAFCKCEMATSIIDPKRLPMIRNDSKT